MVVNLHSFVREPFTDSAYFDYDEFGNVVQKAQRLMDDMIDIEIEQVDKILEKIERDPEPDEVKAIEKICGRMCRPWHISDAGPDWGLLQSVMPWQP